MLFFVVVMFHIVVKPIPSGGELFIYNLHRFPVSIPSFEQSKSLNHDQSH